MSEEEKQLPKPWNFDFIYTPKLQPGNEQKEMDTWVSVRELLYPPEYDDIDRMYYLDGAGDA